MATSLNMEYSDLTMVCTDGTVKTFKAIDNFAEGIKGGLEIGDELRIPFSIKDVQPMMDMIHNPDKRVSISDAGIFNGILTAADYLGLVPRVIEQIDLTITYETAPGFFRAAVDYIQYGLSYIVTKCYRMCPTPEATQEFHVVGGLP